jgi:carbon monoxide dehydrogenase subunit G
MDLTGEFRIEAPQDLVWKALNDADILKASIAGCEELVKTADNEFTAKVTAKVGPVKASFGGKVTLSDLDPPSGYTITGEGSGGAAGFAKGSAKVRLKPAEGGATMLTYQVDAQIGGKLAQIGSRLIEGAARKMSADFFAAFGAEVARLNAATSGGPSEKAIDVSAPEALDSAHSQPTGPKARGLPPAVWIGALIVVVAGVLAFAALR